MEGDTTVSENSTVKVCLINPQNEDRIGIGKFSVANSDDCKSINVLGTDRRRGIGIGMGLVAPYCAIPRDYLSDTPPFRGMGVLGVSTWPIGCDTPSLFSERFPLWEHAKWRCDTPLLNRGISAIPARYLWKQGKWLRYPPLRYYLETVLRDYYHMGGYLALGR